MIKRIVIDNYRCFTGFEFRPNRVNLLLGANGTGKSSLADLILRIQDVLLAGSRVSRVFPPGVVTRWNERGQLRVEIELDFHEKTFVYAVTMAQDQSSVRHRMAIVEERLVCNEKEIYGFRGGQITFGRGGQSRKLPFSSRRSFLGNVEDGLGDNPQNQLPEITEFLEAMRRIRVYRLVPPDFGALSDSRDPFITEDGANFPSWYEYHKESGAEHLQTLEANLRDVLPGFERFRLVSLDAPISQNMLVAVMSDDHGNEHAVGFSDLSDGQKALVLLHALLIDAKQEDSVLIIDEPENYVGLVELQPWLQELDDALADSGQLFVISHHPEVIDYLAAEHSFLFERAKAGPVRVRRFSFDRSEGLKASEQIVLGGFHDG